MQLINKVHAAAFHPMLHLLNALEKYWLDMVFMCNEMYLYFGFNKRQTMFMTTLSFWCKYTSAIVNILYALYFGIVTKFVVLSFYINFVISQWVSCVPKVFN